MHTCSLQILSSQAALPRLNLLLLIDMARLTLNRYSSKNRVVRKAMTRMPFRHRAKQIKKKSKTREEVEAHKAVVKDRKKETNAHLDQCLKQVWDLAESLFERIGTHSVKHWYEVLVQRADRKMSQRKVSRWNAFLSKKIRAQNNGALTMLGSGCTVR